KRLAAPSDRSTRTRNTDSAGADGLARGVWPAATAGAAATRPTNSATSLLVRGRVVFVGAAVLWRLVRCGRSFGQDPMDGRDAVTGRERVLILRAQARDSFPVGFGDAGLRHD